MSVTEGGLIHPEGTERDDMGKSNGKPKMYGILVMVFLIKVLLKMQMLFCTTYIIF